MGCNTTEIRTYMIIHILQDPDEVIIYSCPTSIAGLAYLCE